MTFLKCVYKANKEQELRRLGRLGRVLNRSLLSGPSKGRLPPTSPHPAPYQGRSFNSYGDELFCEEKKIPSGKSTCYYLLFFKLSLKRSHKKIPSLMKSRREENVNSFPHIFTCGDADRSENAVSRCCCYYVVSFLILLSLLTSVRDGWVHPLQLEKLGFSNTRPIIRGQSEANLSCEC